MPATTAFTTALKEAGSKVGNAVREIRRSDDTTTWMHRVIYGEIAQRASSRGPAYWDSTFPGLAPETRAQARTQRMLTRATVAGVAAAAGASTAELLSITSNGWAAPFAVPLGMLSVGAELLYTTTLQIDLAFDLASIYGVPFAGDDVGEISTLLALPLGIELTREPTRHDKPLESRMAEPNTTKPWRVIRQMQRNDFTKEIGSRILKHTVLRNVVPVAGVVVSGVWNQVLLRRFARAADMAIRHRRGLVRACHEMRLGDVAAARTILDGAWLLATTCGDIGHEEALAMATLIDTLPVPERIEVQDASFTDDEETWFAKLPELDASTQDALIHVLALVASASGKLETAERRFLRRLAHTLHRDIDLVAIERDCDRLRRGGSAADAGTSAESWSFGPVSPGPVSA